MNSPQRRILPILMHPAVFLSAWVLLGLLFALQEWVGMHRMGEHEPVSIFLTAWAFHFFLWGAICWILWALFRPHIETGSVATLLTVFLPVSIVLSVVEEMAFLFVFVNLPLSHPHLSYWRRVGIYLDSEFIDNMVIFWCGFFLCRGVGYYERSHENEQVAAKLEAQLATAQLSALRMQLNPHFLFNAMNGISSLMRSDVEAADRMLEQLSFLLRITLERGDAQLIPLRDEMDFIETFLAMQQQRYAGRIELSLSVDSDLYGALVPSMLLQPIVENAFVHGLSKLPANGRLRITIERSGAHMRIIVRNNGSGLHTNGNGSRNGKGVGLANVRSRLRLHYREDFSFGIWQPAPQTVEVIVRLPLQFSSVIETPQQLESAS